MTSLIVGIVTIMVWFFTSLEMKSGQNKEEEKIEIVVVENNQNIKNPF